MMYFIINPYPIIIYSIFFDCFVNLQYDNNNGDDDNNNSDDDNNNSDDDGDNSDDDNILHDDVTIN